MVPTEVNSGKERVDMIVKLRRMKSPPMELKVEALKLVMLTAPITVRSPPIFSMPSRKMSPVTVDPTEIEPATVVQSAARVVASA